MDVSLNKGQNPYAGHGSNQPSPHSTKRSDSTGKLIAVDDIALQDDLELSQRAERLQMIAEKYFNRDKGQEPLQATLRKLYIEGVISDKDLETLAYDKPVVSKIDVRGADQILVNIINELPLEANTLREGLIEVMNINRKLFNGTSTDQELATSIRYMNEHVNYLIQNTQQPQYQNRIDGLNDVIGLFSSEMKEVQTPIKNPGIQRYKAIQFA